MGTTLKRCFETTRITFTKGHIDDKSLGKISRSKCSFFPTKFRFELMGTVTVLSTDADVTMPLIDTERRIILPSF